MNVHVNDTQKLREIFCAVRQQATDYEKSQLLDELCVGNASLRKQVELLLVAAGSASASPLDQMAAMLNPTALEVDSVPGQRPRLDIGNHPFIGAYKLLEQIGQGGFGTVYMAEQTIPVRRKVALKILKPGMDSSEVIARFEAERQALAMMDHPNIARIFDGGTTETGRPYFVMELVRGIPVTAYCDEARLTTDERLTVFIDICQAVQHAHQKGIIHRDLKPSNVLVTMHDDKAVVKVIDFGIAKALSQQLTDRTLFTGYQQMLGTPQYMSPEQAQMSGIDIDTRSDVYSLGVMLYELLTGTTPFDKESLFKGSLDDMRRIIREQEPPRPSARITTMQAQVRSTMADRRRIDQRRISEQLRGELDWIVMKALEKDRNRRYESASSFGADVQRYLRDEPVIAYPPSASYRIRKAIRKHRAGISVGLAISVAVLAGSSLAVWQATRATRAERQATTYFGKSLDAIDLILTKVGSKELIDVPAMSRVRYLVIQDAVRLYLDLLPSSQQNPRVILATARALRMLSNEELFLDRLAEGEATIRKSLTVLNEMRPEDQNAESALIERGTCFQSLGNILNRQSRYDAARQAFHSSLEAYSALNAGVEGKDQYIAGTKMHLAQSLFQQASHSEALQLLTETLTVHDSAFQRSSENWWALAVNLEWLGKLAEQRADFSEALQLGERSFEIAEQFKATVEAENAGSSASDLSVENLGVKKSVLFFQALAAGRIGHLYRLLQQSEKSEQSYLRMFALCNTLVENHPEVPGFLAQQRAALENLGPHIKGETQAEKRARLRKFRNLELDHANQHIVRGRLAEAVGDIDLALSDFKRAGEMEPDNSDIQLTYVYCLQYKRSDLQGALSYVEDLCLKYPKKAVYLTCAAHLEKALGNKERSLERFRKATELEPNFGEAWSELASELDEAGDLAGSAAAMERAVNCPQTTFSVWATFGERLRKLGEANRSIEAYSKAIDMAPTEWYIRKRRAELYIATKQYSSVLDDLAAAIEVKPTDLSILTWLPLEVWTDCPDPAVRDRLMALADRMVFLNSESSEALLVRAVLYAVIKDFGKSDQDFQRAIEADSEKAWPQYLRAITQLSTGRSQEYRQTSDTLTEFAMQNPLPTNLYWAGRTAALSNENHSDVERLLKALEKALKTTPDDSRLQSAIGSLQFRAGQYAAAEQTLMALQGQNTGEVFPAYVSIFLALTHAKQGHIEKTKEMLGIAAHQTNESKMYSIFELWPGRPTHQLLTNEAVKLLDSPVQQPQ